MKSNILMRPDGRIYKSCLYLAITTVLYLLGKFLLPCGHCALCVKYTFLGKSNIVESVTIKTDILSHT